MKKILSALLFLIAFSCAEESIRKEIDSSSLNLATLSFKDSEEMSSYVLNVNKSRSNAGDSEINNSKFQSFDNIYKKAIDELSEAQTTDEVASLLKIYGDVVIQSDETFLPKLENSFYRTICNREKIYESEGFFHKVLDNQFIVIASKEKLSQLRKIESIENLDTSLFKLIQYNNTEPKAAISSGRTLSDACSNNMEYSYYYDPSGCKSDRKVYVRAYIYWAISGSNYTPWLISETWGRRRAGTLCYWYFYDTKLNSRDAYFDVKIVINGITNHYILTEASIPDYYGTVDEGSHTIWNNALTGGPITWQGGTPPAISFTRAFVEASSQGTNNNWVSVDCIGI